MHRLYTAAVGLVALLKRSGETLQQLLEQRLDEPLERGLDGRLAADASDSTPS